MSNETVERFHARTCIQQSNMPTLRRGKGNCIGVTWPGRHHCGVFFSFLTTKGMGRDVRYNDTREANELATGSKLLTLIRFLWRWCISYSLPMSNLPIYSMCSTHASYPQPCSLWTPLLFNYTCFRYEMAAGKKKVPRGLLSQE